jgi:hypothetical protein
MVFILYFLIGGSVLMYYILKFDTHQSKRMRKLYKDNEDLKPMFMIKSAERKLRTLSNKLYGAIPPGSYTCEECMQKIANEPKQLAARELGELVTKYNSGSISVQNYNAKLAEMLSVVSGPKSMAYHSSHKIKR